MKRGQAQDRAKGKGKRSILSAMDVLDPTTMKDAANCDTQCDMLTFVNHQISERKWHFLGQPGSVCGSVSLNLLYASYH